MAIELQVVSVTALVTGEPRERQMYEGRGDDRKAKGRVVDVAGRPLSSVTVAVTLTSSTPLRKRKPSDDWAVTDTAAKMTAESAAR